MLPTIVRLLVSAFICVGLSWQSALAENVALEVVVDKSGSMAQGDSLTFTKTALGAVLPELGDDDYVGVIGFDAVPFEVVRLAKVKSQRDSVAGRLANLYPHLRSNPLPALLEAHQRLAAISDVRREILLITDGAITETEIPLNTVAQRFKQEGIRMSVYHFANDGAVSTEYLQSLTRTAGGSFVSSKPTSAKRVESDLRDFITKLSGDFTAF